VALVETTRLLASGGEAAHLAVLVHGLDDPVDAGVLADGLVLGVDEDDLEVLVGRVLVDPVGVEDAEVGAAAADALFGDGAERALELELVDTLVDGLAWRRYQSSVLSFKSRYCWLLRTVGGTLGGLTLAATTSYADAVDDISLLGLVTETAGLVGAGRTGCAVDDIELAKLQSKYPQQCSTGNNEGRKSFLVLTKKKSFGFYRTSQQRTRSRKRRISLCFFF